MSGSSFAPVIPTLTIGGRVMTDLTNLVMLYGKSTAAAPYATLRKPNATAGYVVPASKQFRIVAVRYTSDAAAASSVQVGYGDNDVGGSSAAAPTNFTQNGGSGFGLALVLTAATGVYEFPANFVIPTGKYPAMLQGNTSGTMEIYGYEEAV